MAIIPPAVAVTAGFIWKEVSEYQAVQKENEDKDWDKFEPRLTHTLNKYAQHAKKGEFAQAIEALKEHIALHVLRGPLASEVMQDLNAKLNNLISTAQAKGLALSRDFKGKEESLKDDPYALSATYYKYIEDLKVALPEEDEFLRKEVERWEQLNSPFSIYD